MLIHPVIKTTNPMPKQKNLPIFFLAFCVLQACTSNSQEFSKPLATSHSPIQQASWSPLDTSGHSIQERFTPPPGFERVSYPTGSFAAYLQQLPLKPDGSRVRYYNGAEKPPAQVYLAVVDMDIGKRDLQQCADAIMRLRGEYLYAQQRLDDIRFNFTNGFDMTFAKWRQGYRVKIKGNSVTWVKSKAPSSSYTQFRSYMNMVFAYAGTLSLAKELHSAPIEEMQVGDVLIQGGSPGHAVIVVDMAINETGEKRYLLAQSYMPAQDIQILQNPQKDSKDPWFGLPKGTRLATPEWDFTVHDLKRF